MMKRDVRSLEQALAYITDCTLATVCDLAMKKSKSKSEYVRQQSIAQTAIDWGVEMGVDFSTTRAAAVIEAGSVKAWAERFESSAAHGASVSASASAPASSRSQLDAPAARG